MHSVISLMRVKLGILQVKKGGGLSINATVTLTQMSEKMAQLILHEYSILSSCHNNIISMYLQCVILKDGVLISKLSL